MSNAATIERDVATKPSEKTRTAISDVLFVLCGVPVAGLMLAGFVLGLISN